ncbi:hypothetical protein LZ30DRAFT_689204 [Colletotrichum cereale]|nr:hypothetical protein LZ30DRAFT_689204 [Colletotrichum cereale]
MCRAETPVSRSTAKQPIPSRVTPQEGGVVEAKCSAAPRRRGSCRTWSFDVNRTGADTSILGYRDSGTMPPGVVICKLSDGQVRGLRTKTSIDPSFVSPELVVVSRNAIAFWFNRWRVIQRSVSTEAAGWLYDWTVRDGLAWTPVGHPERTTLVFASESETTKRLCRKEACSHEKVADETRNTSASQRTETTKQTIGGLAYPPQEGPLGIGGIVIDNL